MVAAGIFADAAILIALIIVCSGEGIVLMRLSCGRVVVCARYGSCTMFWRVQAGERHQYGGNPLQGQHQQQ